MTFTPGCLYDRICEHEATRALYKMGDILSVYANHAEAFIRWVADLGRREGEWMREPK